LKNHVKKTTWQRRIEPLSNRHGRAGPMVSARLCALSNNSVVRNLFLIRRPFWINLTGKGEGLQSVASKARGQPDVPDGVLSKTAGARASCEGLILEWCFWGRGYSRVNPSI
jgi:hypothetical protein